MKKKLATILLCGIALFAQSQEATVEKSVIGIQTGFLGIWTHGEFKLSNRIALRGEIGIDAGIAGGDNYENTIYLSAPVITLEPRWYYNLKKRVNKSRRIDGNSGNFISIKTSYHPDLLITSSEDNIDFINDISIVPTWGIRRNIGKHFNYETGLGIGYVHYFEKENAPLKEQSDIALNLHLRIGYRF